MLICLSHCLYVQGVSLRNVLYFIGEYDERVFLGEDAEEDIGTPSAIKETNELTMTPEGLNKQIQGRSESRLIPMTPLSGKHLTKDKEQSAVTPVSASTNLVARYVFK